MSYSLIIGTTRSGKTQTFVLPQIRLLCSTQNKQSMVINDPKGELLENSYTLLKRNGYKIVVLNLRDTSNSSQWNPLKPCAIFMVVPDEKTNRHVLASLYISQCYSSLVDIANNYPRKILPQRVQFILDEFGNMVRIPDMDTKLTVALGRSIIFNLFLQDLNQLETKYNKAAGTIRSNCNNFIYINSIDETTNKFVSSILGNKTIEYNTYSGTIGEWVKNQNVNYKGRPLMTHNEVEKLEFGEALIKRQRTYPLRTKFTPFYELNIPITDIKNIPLKQNSNTLQDILFPFSVLEEDDKFDDVIDMYQNADIDLAIEIADKLTNGEFSSFLSDGDYVSCFDVTNHLKGQNMMSQDLLLTLEAYLDAKMNL